MDLLAMKVLHWNIERNPAIHQQLCVQSTRVSASKYIYKYICTATYRKSPLVEIKTFPTLIHLTGTSLAKIDSDALWTSRRVSYRLEIAVDYLCCYYGYLEPRFNTFKLCTIHIKASTLAGILWTNLSRRPAPISLQINCNCSSSILWTVAGAPGRFVVSGKRWNSSFLRALHICSIRFMSGVSRRLIWPGKANYVCALLDRRRGSGKSDNNGVDVIWWAADVNSVGNEAT